MAKVMSPHFHSENLLEKKSPSALSDAIKMIYFWRLIKLTFLLIFTTLFFFINFLFVLLFSAEHSSSLDWLIFEHGKSGKMARKKEPQIAKSNKKTLAEKIKRLFSEINQKM